MSFLGLNVVDWCVIAAYFVAIIYIALRARRRTTDTEGYYQSNRSFGRTLFAFLNFGNMTDAGQTAGVTREIYRQGLSGVWFQNLVLFHTPFQWFIAAFQRRARYIAPGDLFMHRFESRFLAGLYAVVLVAIAIFANSMGYLLTGKTVQAIMVKPPAEYTVAERHSVELFDELTQLERRDFASLDRDERTRLEALQQMDKRGELHSFISYIDLTWFYAFYAVMIAAYTVLGGLLAVAIVDVIQGVLIVFLSMALIPVALERIGGFAGLHASVPASMFDLFGASPTSEYTWYFVASFALLNLVVNAPKNFTIGGSPKDDHAARVGMVTGALFKRFMMIAWAFTGLLAVGLYAGKVADPTNVWGIMTRDLLGVGAIGLMIAAVFSANMDGSSTVSLESSAAFVKNIFVPLVPDATERTQVMLGRTLVAAILLVSIFFANHTDDILAVFKYVLSVGSIVGPTFWLVYFYRKLNTRAVAIQMIISIILIVVLPNVVPMVPGATTSPALTMQTREQFVRTTVRASEAEVRAGMATRVGERITHQERIPPVGIFFETVTRENPSDTTSRWRGSGLFRPEIWILDKLGFDFRGWRTAGISTASFLFDAILPFILLIVLSQFTPRNSEEALREFYARIHTPAVADAEEDRRLVQEKIDDPSLIEADKMFPGTDWEMWKPTRYDIVGFLACVGFVLIVIAAYVIVAGIGA